MHEHAWHDPDFSPLRVLKKWHPAPRYHVNDLYAGAHCLIHLIEAHLTIKDRPRTLPVREQDVLDADQVRLRRVASCTDLTQGRGLSGIT